jgi:RHS repeat-associated protein
MNRLLSALVCVVSLPFSTWPQVESQPGALLSAGAVLSASALVERGRDHVTWERYRFETNRLGRVTIHTNRVMELETGKFYQADRQWQESREEIEIVANGALARRAPHQAAFATDVSSPVSVEVLTPNATRLKIRPLCLIYYDFHARTNVLIAELKGAEGWLVGTNEVVYPDAFTDFRADVRYTFKKSGLEQDIILLQRPPLPEEFGLNPMTTWLWVVTEFVDPPRDVQVERRIRRGWKKSTVDKIIRIGGMTIGPGSAFGLGLGQDRRAGVPVEKHWRVIDGRTFLIEEVSFRRIVPHLRNLQTSAEPASGATGSPRRRLASNSLALPPVRVASEATPPKAMQVASAMPRQAGLVLDFPLVSGTGVVLQGDQTYVVTGTVNLTNAVIEGGTVVKYNRGASLNLIGPVQCLTGPYRPAIFTAVDDDSVGAPVGTGALDGTYAHCALSLGLGGDLQYLNIRYANEAVHCSSGDYSVSHAQFVSCAVGFHSETANFTNRNILMCQVATNFYGSYFHGLVEHLSSDQAMRLVWDYDFEYLLWCGGDPSSSLKLVNTLTASITNGYSFPVAVDHVQDFPSAAGVFEVAGCASHYLVDGSTNRNAGTTNIQSALANALKAKTTYPPVVVSDGTISTDVTLSPQTPRDTNAPDLGYHYDPLDYLLQQVLVTNATVELQPGTALGTAGSWGVGLLAGSQLISLGSPANLNRIVRCAMVQENPDTIPLAFASVVGDFLGGAAPAQASFRFTCWSMAAPWYHFQTFAHTMLNSFSDCQFHGGMVGIYDPSVAFTNCLFERAVLRLDDSDRGVNLSPTLRNCLFFGGQLYANHAYEGTWTFRDNLFDRTRITQYGTIDHAFNGYTPGSNRLTPTNANDVVAGLDYQTGPLGNRYQPTNSAFIDKGSVTNAALAGLYHHTTRTNQVEEGASRVDLGFHYAAVQPPLIMTQPSSQIVTQGGSATFSVTVTNTMVVTYQWKFNGADVPGATGDSFTRGNAQPGDAGSYAVLVFNEAGSVTSSNALLTVNFPPMITAQPQSQVVAVGTNVTLSVIAVGTAPLGYQWRFNGTNLAGATASSFARDNLQLADAGSYAVVVTNAYGSVTSSNAVVTVIEPPVIVTHPASQTVGAGTNVTLSVAAAGTAPFSYQWYFNSAAQGGATNSTLALDNVQTASAGTYFVTVANSAGSAASSNALLTVVDCVGAPSGLVGWWPGDGDGLDLAGTNHGALYGGAVATAQGKVGQAFSLDGTNGYFLVPDAPALKPTNLTVEAWVRFTSLDSPAYGAVPAGETFVVFKKNTRTSDFEGYWLGKQRDGGDYFVFGVSPAGGGMVSVRSASNLSTGTWYHVAGVRGSNYLQLYVNGQLVGATNVTGAQDYDTTPLYFGTSGQYYWDRKLAGQLDEVSLYNRALSGEEIEAIYDATSLGKCLPAVSMSVSLSTPADGATILLPASPVLTARVWPARKLASRVEFFSNGVKLGETSTGTNGWFSCIWTNPPTGSNYSLTAVATGNNGITATSQVSRVTFLNGAFVKGVNLNGPAVVIEGNQWTSYAAALASGLSLQGGTTNFRAFTPAGADGDTATMLQSMIVSNRLPPLSQQTSLHFAYTQPTNSHDRWMTLTNVPAGYLVTNGHYRAWCVQYGTDDPSGNNYSCNLFYSYGWPDPRFPGRSYNKVNYIINNPGNASSRDIQCAIWNVLGSSGFAPDNTNNYLALVNAASTNANFVPGPSQKIVVVVEATSGDMKQPFVIELPPTGLRTIGFTLTQTLTNGDYALYLYLAESEADHLRSLDIKVQGAPAASGVGDLPLGSWSRLGPLAAAVTNGALTLDVISPVRGDPVLMGLAIYAAVTNQLPTVAITSADQAVCPASAVTFCATNITGPGPLSCQWNKDGVPLDGETNTTLLLNNVTTNSTGTYSIVVTNLAGGASDSATLTVWTNVTVVVPPASTNACPGATASFSVTAAGTDLQYQWYRGESPLTGQTGSALLITNVQATNAGTYCVLVSGTCGASTNCAALTVYQSVNVTNPPVDVVTLPGINATFTVGASGTGLSYQWYKGTKLLTNKVSTSLIITNVSAPDAGTYCVIVGGACGSAVHCAKLTVECLPPLTNLVGWWQGETNGYEAMSANNAVLDDVAFTNGQVGGAFRFDGVSACGYVPACSALNVGEGMGLTIECWIEPDDLYHGAPLVAWDNGWDLMVGLWVNQTDGGALSADLYDMDWNGGTISSAANVLTAGSFQHVAVTYETASGLAVLYRNGNPLVTNYLYSILPFTEGDLYLGGYPAYWLSYSGLLDEVGIYNRALSGDEIRAIHAAGSAGRCGIPPSWILQPASQMVTEGNKVTLRSLAAGTSLNYQWYTNGSPKTGATSPRLSLPSVQTNDAGTYFVVVSNLLGSITSTNAVLTVNPAVCSSAPTGLISWWRAETNAWDSAGTNQGTLMNGAAFSPGKVGQGFSFNGSNQCIAIPWSPGLVPTNYTVETWIKPLGEVDWQVLLFGQANGSQLIAWPGSTWGRVLLALRHSGWWAYLQSSHEVELGVWTHLAGTWDGVTMRLYINGELDATTQPGVSVWDSGCPFYIGGFYATNGPCGTYADQFFNGVIDEVSYYSRALSDGEIQALYDASFAGKCQEPPVITLQPTNQTVGLGSNATFTVSATGTPQLRYQWYFNGTNLAGKTGTFLTLTTVQASQAGTYTVLVTNAFGSVLSSNAVLTITNVALPAVQIISPVDQILFVRTTNAITATVSMPTGSNTWVQFFVWETNNLGYAYVPTNGQCQVQWQPLAAGRYVLTAFATNDSGASGWSAPVSNIVRGLPTVAITNPADGAIFGPAPVNLTVSASASADATNITSVVFYEGTNVLGTSSVSPYSFSWSNVAAGSSRLSAKATDARGMVGISPTVRITVDSTNQPPWVSAGLDQTIVVSSNATLAGSVSDDGLPRGNSLSAWWVQSSGPGTVTFGSPSNALTEASCSTTGTYVLQLIASDGQLTATDSVTVVALPANRAPEVSAGTDQTLVLPALTNTNLLPYISVSRITSNAAPYAIGIDYYAPSNALAVSCTYMPVQKLYLLATDGTLTAYTNLQGNFYEHQEGKIVTVRDTLGGFGVGDLFYANGYPGEVVRIKADGTVPGTSGQGGNAWVVLPDTSGQTGNLQGAFCVDRTGVYGGDLIVVNQVGKIWRVNSNGVPTYLTQIVTNVGPLFDGMVTLPNDPERYGPWAGRIIIGASVGSSGVLYAVNTNGDFAAYDFGLPDVELLLVVPENENLFFIDCQNDLDYNPLWSAAAFEFQGMAGDLLVAPEGYDQDRVMRRVHWNGTGFEVQPIASLNVSGLEHATFAPFGVQNQPGVGQVLLGGCASDDGKLWPTNVVSWSKESGPGPVVFGDATLTNTVATFSVPGNYYLRLTAYDGQFTSYTNVMVTVLRNQAPVVSAGTNQVIATNSTTLHGSVSEDGLPFGLTNLLWSQVSGPGTAWITNSDQLATGVGFSTAGVYVLRLTADDGQATNAAEVVVTVQLASLTLTPAYDLPAISDAPHTVTARLVDAYNNPIVGTNITLSISNYPDADFATNYTGVTDSDGTVQFTYSGPGGTGVFPNPDHILAMATNNGQVLTATAEKVWPAEIGCTGIAGIYYGEPGLSLTWPGHSAVYCRFTGLAGHPVKMSVTGDPGALILVVRDPGNRIIATSLEPSLVLTPWLTGDYLIEVIEVETTSPFVDVYLSLSDFIPPLQVLYAGTNVPNGASIGFLSTAVHQPVTNSFTITNLTANWYQIDSVSTVGDFKLEPDLSGTNIGPYASTNLNVVFDPATNGFHFGWVTVTVSGAPFAQTIYLFGNAWPTGAPPAVALTAPASGADFFSPASIPITATVTPGLTNVSYVLFRAATTNGAFTLGRSSTGESNLYSFLWSEVPEGDYTLSAAAVDVEGRTGTAAPVLVHVNSSNGNHTPTANWDRFIVLASSRNNVLRVLTNDYDPDGDALRITAIIPSTTEQPHGTATIIDNGTAIAYTPPSGLQSPPDSPGDGFSYEISDGRGGTALGGVLVDLFAAEMPQVAIVDPPGNMTTNAGANVPLTARVNNFEYVTRVEFYIGQTLLGTVTNGSVGDYTFNWSAIADACNCPITATAYDLFGQYNTSPSIFIGVTVPPNIAPPTASIDSLVGTTTNYGLVELTELATLREGVFQLYGRAFQSQGSNVTWRLGVYSSDGVLLRDLTPPPHGASGANTNSLGSATTSNLMATCDFSTLPNGVYDLRLRVVGAYRAVQSSVAFRLESGLKLGQFSFSQQDLVIPVSGVPLSITRTYNSLNHNRGDFGYGWTWALGDLDVVLDESRADVPDLSDPDDTPFSKRTGGGRNVTLTLPGGQRTTFAFYLDGPHGCVSGLPSRYCYHAKWRSAPGVTARLETVPGYEVLNLVMELGHGEPFWEAAPGVPLDDYDFPGFILTTLDGTRYIIDREDLGKHDVGSDAPYTVHAYGKPYLHRIEQHTQDQVIIESDRITYENAAHLAQRHVVFERNADGLIQSIYDPTGLAGADSPPPGAFPAVRYEYDSYQNLMNAQALVDRAAGTYVTNTFFYTNLDFPHYITGIVDPRGILVARNEYDDEGRLTAVVDAEGNRTEFTHNLGGQVEKVIDRLGRTNIFAYDLRGNVTATTNALGGITTMLYDVNNNKTNEVAYLNGQPYATNCWLFDTNNLLLVSYNPLGYSNVFTYNANGQVLTSTRACGCGYSAINHYDDRGNLDYTADALWNTNFNFFDPSTNLLLGSRDPAGTLSTNYYDAAQNLIATATLDTSGILSSNTFGYDDNANRTNATVWRRVGSVWTGAATAYVYDGQNRVVQTIDPDGGTSTVAYNDIGKKAQTIDKLGRVTRYEYDDQGRLFRTTFPDLTTETSRYDHNGNRISSTDRLLRVTTYGYDALNRMVQTVFPDSTTNITVYDDLGRVKFNLDTRGTVSAFGHDPADQRVAVTNAWGTSLQATNGFTFDANGNQVTATDPLGRTTTSVFDPLNRVVQVLYSDGTTNFTGYDGVGRRVAQTNQDGVVTRFGYDGAGRLKAVTNAFGTAQQMVTQYQYDEAGNEVAQVDALNRTTSFAYDGMGRRIKRTLPGNQSETMGYDLAGNLVLHTNFNSAIITNQFDALNRLTNRTSVDGYRVSFTYQPTGQRQSMSDPSGVTSYGYDERDRLRFKRFAWPGLDPVSLRYLYDEAGNVADLWSSTPNGVNLHYDYDPLNRLTNVLSGGSLAASYGFDFNGNLKSARYGNSVTNLYQYDGLNRLTNLVWKSGASPLASFGYQLGKTGNRTNLSETVDGASRTYGWQFDALYRLTNETISALGTLSYGLDPVGNRTNRQSTIGNLPSTAYSYSSNDWLTNDAYDSNGNTLWSTNGAIATGPYYYDVEDRLTNFNDSVFLGYNGDGIRASKTVNGVTTYFLVDDRNPTGYAQVLEELTYNGGTVLLRAYSYGLALISQQEFDQSHLPSELYYFVSDGHGSTRLLVDTNGAAQGTFAYDAYGTLVASNGTPATTHLYSGEQFDSDLGFYYLRARHYNPQIGRFWTMDSYEGNSQDPLSLHKYLYAHNDPMNGWDPSGRFAVSMAALDMGAIISRYAVNAGRNFQASWGLGRHLLKGLDFDTDDPFQLADLHIASQQLQLMDITAETRRGLAELANSIPLMWDAVHAVQDLSETIMWDLLLSPLFVQACFPAGTQVILGVNEDGVYVTKSIEDLREGELVLARNESGQFDDAELCPILKLHKRTSDHVRIIVISDADGTQETIRTTDEHPFWVAGRGWTSAADLRSNDCVNEADDSNDAVVESTSREEHPEGVSVYNFEVAGDHTYFVAGDRIHGSIAVWVHNVCRGARALTKSELGGQAVFQDTSQIRASISVRNGVAFVNWEAISGGLRSLPGLTVRLAKVAKEEGAQFLRVSARVANQTLRKVLTERYGMEHDATTGIDYIIIELE